MNRKRLRALVAVMLSGAAALWFAWGVDWAELARSLADVKLGWVALACCVILVEFLLRAVRWKVLLRPLGGNVTIPDLWAATVIGAAMNTLFPFRAGEVARALVAHWRTEHPIAAIVATNVMERVYDLFGMVTVLVAMALVLPPNNGAEGELVSNLKLYGGLFGLFALSCMVVFFVLATREKAARAIFARIVAIAPRPVADRLLGLFDGFVAGLQNTRDRAGLWQAGALAMGIWFNGVLAIWCLFRAFSLDLPLGAACFVAVAIALTVALPQAPGFVGVFHVAIEKTMVLWGMTQMPAKGFAIVFWGVSFLPITLVGLGALWAAGISVSAFNRDAPPALRPDHGHE